MAFLEVGESAILLDCMYTFLKQTLKEKCIVRQCTKKNSQIILHETKQCVTVSVSILCKISNNPTRNNVQPTKIV